MNAELPRAVAAAATPPIYINYPALARTYKSCEHIYTFSLNPPILGSGKRSRHDVPCTTTGILHLQYRARYGETVSICIAALK
jgi:hypothetical protein